MVCSLASTVTGRPFARAVADVTGPIEATRVPGQSVPPVSSRKLLTVDELVNVIQWGAASSESRAREDSGATVR